MDSDSNASSNSAVGLSCLTVKRPALQSHSFGPDPYSASKTAVADAENTE